MQVRAPAPQPPAEVLQPCVWANPALPSNFLDLPLPEQAEAILDRWIALNGAFIDCSTRHDGAIRYMKTVSAPTMGDGRPHP